MMFRAAILSVLLIFVAGCGYQIVGLEKRTVATSVRAENSYFIALVNNNSTDLTITDDIRNLVERFFTENGVFSRNRNSATHIVRITLDNKDVRASILSTTREALSSGVTLRYTIVVEDKQGRMVHNRSYSLSQSFSPGSDVTEFNENLWEAVDECTTSILTQFKYDFERTR